jgi:Tfp pilus assembly protein PilP
MKKTLFPVLILVLSACSSKDEQFCKCMQAGEDLNEYSAKMLSEEVTAEKAAKMKELKDNKKKECVNYQTMMGDEMLKRKANCH